MIAFASSPSREHRSGFSLVELLVVIGIVAVILGLLLAAVQRVRQTALRMIGFNDERQLLIATHNYAETHQGSLPKMRVWQPRPLTWEGTSAFYDIMPYIEETQQILEEYKAGTYNRKRHLVRAFISLADPTIADERNSEPASYCWNGQVVFNDATFSSTFRDGTSNTILFAEHYSICGDRKFWWNSFSYIMSLRPPAFALNGPRIPPVPNFPHRAGLVDNYPVTKGDPPRTTGFLPGTFQSVPKSTECDYRYPQSGHPGGMVVGMADGSVRFVSTAVSEEVFWSAVSPAAGDLAPSDLP